jgi:hypothetical protein
MDGTPLQFGNGMWLITQAVTGHPSYQFVRPKCARIARRLPARRRKITLENKRLMTLFMVISGWIT